MMMVCEIRPSKNNEALDIIVSLTLKTTEVLLHIQVLSIFISYLLDVGALGACVEVQPTSK